MDGRKEGGTDGLTDRPTAGWKDRQTERRTEGMAHEETDRWIDRQGDDMIDKQIYENNGMDRCKRIYG